MGTTAALTGRVMIEWSSPSSSPDYGGRGEGVMVAHTVSTRPYRGRTGDSDGYVSLHSASVAVGSFTDAESDCHIA